MNVMRISHCVALVLGRRSPDSAGERRDTSLIRTALSALAGKGISLLVGIVSVPLTVGYLGAERYGLWVVISTLTTWLSFADFGLSHSVTNSIAGAKGEDEWRARGHVASAFWMLCALAAALAVIFSSVVGIVDWPALFNVTSERARAELAPALLTGGLILLCNLPLSLADRVLRSLQEGVIANYWSATGNIASLTCLIAATRYEAGLPGLVAAFMGPPVAVNGLCTLWTFIKHKPNLSPQLAAADRTSGVQLLKMGSLFFVVQLCGIFIFQTDTVIIASYLSSEQVGPYSIAYRLFSYLLLVQSLWLAPLWPAYSEAAVKGDPLWIRKIFWSTLIAGVCFTGAGSLALVLFGKDIITMWAGKGMVPSTMLLIGLGCWTILAAWGNTCACLLNALNRVTGQAVYGVATAGLNIVLSIWLAKKFGVIGVIGGTILAYLLTAFWLATAEVFLALRTLVKAPQIAR